jgi:hypothetical protein
MDIQIAGIFAPKCPTCALCSAFKRRVERPGLCWCDAFGVEWDSSVFACIEYVRADDEDIAARIDLLNQTGMYGKPPGGWSDESKSLRADEEGI